MLGNDHIRVDQGSGGQNLTVVSAGVLRFGLQDGQIVVGVQFEVGMHQILAIGNDIVAETPQNYNL